MSFHVYEHDEVFTRFRRTLAHNRLASTYLFVGPAGVGKRRFARLLTASLLCSQAADESLSPCGACESCRLLAASNHPDVIEVARPEGKSVLPIDLFIGDKEHRNQQGLCHEISLKPYLGNRRVAVIDDADDLNVESANCLLKTLEEPPPRSVLILVGESLSRQLPTIRSRCQVVRFGPLGEATVARVLTESDLLEEGDNAGTLAAASGGSVATALAARDSAAADFAETLLRRLSNRGFDPIRLAAEAVAHSAEGGAEPAEKRARLSRLIDTAVSHYRGAMVGQATDAVAPETAVRCIDACLAAETALGRNANQATLVQTWLTNLWRAQMIRQ
ncbi:DNA polymerase III subunit tau [Posidoniimonas polymericola]|uniref:DNA polymerase III subunit tau n=1 Tax=Posidoniimonas polymericola TaxID=2528002 RepID=A0A5C5YQ17_9BACT|nr:DNA polymerase III subunit [Posidoniimonas polymericola]TWT76867.1 DNA polymerase III subunit tau [Posidoniimonas polymericola]